MLVKHGPLLITPMLSADRFKLVFPTKYYSEVVIMVKCLHQKWYILNYNTNTCLHLNC